MSDLFSLDGKHVLVTGGSSGLGRFFFAVLLAARGAQVTVAARRAEALAKTVDDIGNRERSSPERRDGRHRSGEPSRAHWTTAEGRFGPIDIVVNQRRRDGKRGQLLIKMRQIGTKFVDTNLKGVWLVRAGRGAANGPRTSSEAPSSISPRFLGLRVASFRRTVCDPRKLAFVQMTKVLALEWARLWHSSQRAFAPGYFETELNDDFFGSDGRSGAHQAGSAKDGSAN